MSHDPLKPAQSQTAFWNYYQAAEDSLAEAGVQTRIYIVKTTDSMNRSILMLAPVAYHPLDDGKVWVGLISHTIIDGTVVFKVSCQPIDMVRTWGVQGWTMLRNPRVVYDLAKEGCPDMRPKLPLLDNSKGTDQPHLDGYFDHAFSIIAGWTPQPDFKVGDLLPHNDNLEASLSYAPVFVRPGEVESPDLRVATSRSMVHHYSRPASVRLGWGNYDMFEMCMSCGRRVTPDMVPEVTEGEDDWTKQSPRNDKPRIFISDQSEYQVPRIDTLRNHPPLPMTKGLEFIAENPASGPPLPMPASARNVHDYWVAQAVSPTGEHL